MSYTVAIIPAAGYGLRLKNKVSKPLIKIKGIPILIYALQTITRHALIKEVIIVANQNNIRAIKAKIKQYRIGKIKDIVLGGPTRRISVEKGLKKVSERADFVLIHDAVRPFIHQGIITQVIKEAGHSGAAIVGVPVKATIKKFKIIPPKRDSAKCGKNSKSKIIEKTINRSSLCEIQTPQVFRRDLIIKAYKRFKDTDVTDDAALIEKLGVKVALVSGSYENIKITTPEDLALAEAIVRKRKVES
jgi:2-C-methyl-D-erythritol 4-phosphate cytidylyltransferase